MVLSPGRLIIATHVKGGKQNSKQDQLQNLLNQHIRDLSAEAIQSEGNISASKLKALERLARLVEIHKAVQPPSPQVRWPVLVLLTLTLIIVSLLLFARVSSTEIELDLSLSEVSFRLPEQQVLTEEMRLSSLGVSGMQQIQLPRSETKEAQVFQTQDGSGIALRLAPGIKGQREGLVTLSTILLPAGAYINLRPTEIPQQYRLVIQRTELDLRVSVKGQIELGQPGMPPEQINFLIPKSIHLQSGPKDISLDINLLTGSKAAFSRKLLADSLSLFQVDEHVSGEHTIVRRISTIQSGTLYLESLGGKERRFRPGQELRFESSAGEIRTLELKEDHIAFAFHGHVQGMTTGGEETPFSLMPTYLEWLSARHGLSLLWGTTLYVFGIIFSVIRWWRASP